MHPLPAIPEYPESILTNPDFQAAQAALLEHIQAIPGDRRHWTDSMHEFLYDEAEPQHVFPELEFSTCDKQSDDIDIVLRAHFSHEFAVIVSGEGPGRDLLEMRIGVDRSREFIQRLNIAQKIIILQYAFAVRCHQLYEYLEKPGNIDEISRLSMSISNLHNIFDRQIQALLQEA